jgi:DASH complex subunit DAD1
MFSSRNMSHIDEDSSFFETERDKLSREITSVSPLRLALRKTLTRAQGFEELLSSTNVLNRKLEEVLGMTREYDTIAALWQSFYQLMRGPTKDDDEGDEKLQGLPGTGGHLVAVKQSKDN